MSPRILIATLSAALLAVRCGAGPVDDLHGKHVLFERPTAVTTVDAIEFFPGGKCRVDANQNLDVPGTYWTEGDRLVIHTKAMPLPERGYTLKVGERSFALIRNGDPDLIFVRLPSPPHPDFAEIVGIFYAHSDYGDAATEITANHRFHAHLHDLIEADHICYDISIEGTCSYTDGVVTYLPERSNAPQPDKYLRDFVIRRDENGLWVIDPFFDKLQCQRPAPTLDLPPPPDGYRLVRKEMR